MSPKATVRTMRREADGGLHVNQYPDAYRVGPAAPSTPWCMYLAGPDGRFRYVAFDLDAKTDEDYEHAADDADVLTRILDTLAIAHVTCRSSAAGGFHVWIRVDADAATVAELADAARGALRTLDHGMLHNPATGAVRPPGAPHRDGSASTVLRGNVAALTAAPVTADALAAVTAALRARRRPSTPESSAPSGPVDARHQTHRELTAWGRGHMATIHGGDNPSWTGFACLLAAATAGWSLADVEHAARTAPGMEHYRTKNTGRGDRRPRNPQEAAARLERQWAKAQSIAATRGLLGAAARPERDLTDLAQLVDAAEDVHTRFRVSPGRWNANEAAAHERAVLTALTYLTLHTGKTHVAASVRTLALLTGIGRTTAGDALTRLQAHGLITRTATADGSNAAEWRLTPPLSTASEQVRSQPFKNPRPPAVLFDRRADLLARFENDLTDLRHDVFTRAGLGHLAGRVYATMRHEDPVTVEDASDRLGVPRHRIIRVLSRLRTHRLVVTTNTGWRLHRRDLRDAAARALNVIGTLAARALLYARERELWTWWLAEEAFMRAEPRQRRRRPHATARVIFQATDSRGGEEAWPAYPRDASGLGDHRTARSIVHSPDGVERLRSYELAA
jgi:DNA-binding IscR family transcriptional regulator